MIAVACHAEPESTAEQVRTARLIAALSGIPAEFTLTPTARKTPIRPGWQQENLSHSDIKRLLSDGGWIKRDDGSGYKQYYDGIALIIPKGYVVADIDGKTAHKLFGEITGQAQPDKTVAWSSGKPHNGSLLYRLPDDLSDRIEALPGNLSKIRLTECPTWKTHGSDAIELLLGGSRATLPPSAHPETEGYEFKLDWEYGVQSAPDWIVQAIEAEVAKREYWAAQPQLQFTGIVGEDSIEQWLQTIDPDSLDYDAWVKVGMSIKSATPDNNGLELWNSWSQRGSKYRPGECESRWDSFSEGRVPIAYLARLAGFELTAIGAGIGFTKPDPARTEAQRNRDHLITKRMLTFRSNYKQATDRALYLSQTPKDKTIWYKGWKESDPLKPELLAQTILINGGIGSGKTEAMLRAIASWGRNRQIIWITSRANLNTQTGQRAEKLGLVVYNHQDDVKFFNEMLRTKQPGIYTFCLEGMSDYHTAHIDWASAIVVIDEFSGVRGEASSASPALFAELERCLREAGTLFALDANLSDFDLDIISLYRLGKSRKIYRQVESKSTKKIAWVECRNKDGAISLSHDGIQFAWIEARLKAGESFVIASDSKSALKTALLHCQELSSNMVIATSETIEFNRQLFPMPDLVIEDRRIHRFGYSPVAQSGLDIQTQFDQGLLLYCGIVPPDQALQLMGRCRNCHDWTISAPRRSLNPSVSFNALTESKIAVTSAALLDSLKELNPNTSIPGVAWGNAQRMIGEVFSAFASESLYCLLESQFEAIKTVELESNASLNKQYCRTIKRQEAKTCLTADVARGEELRQKQRQPATDLDIWAIEAATLAEKYPNLWNSALKDGGEGAIELVVALRSQRLDKIKDWVAAEFLSEQEAEALITRMRRRSPNPNSSSFRRYQNMQLYRLLNLGDLARAGGKAVADKTHFNEQSPEIVALHKQFRATYNLVKLFPSVDTIKDFLELVRQCMRAMGFQCEAKNIRVKTETANPNGKYRNGSQRYSHSRSTHFSAWKPMVNSGSEFFQLIFPALIEAMQAQLLKEYQAIPKESPPESSRTS